jgi:hypothetical protein
MRVFYENLVNPVENFYSGVSTTENIIYLEDIIKTTTTDIYVQNKTKTASSINYNQSSIDINGIIKVRNHLYFINNYRNTYNNYLPFETNRDNVIKVIVTGVEVDNDNP